MSFRLPASLVSERRDAFSQSAKRSAWLRPVLVLLLLLLATQCCTAGRNAEQTLNSLGATRFVGAAQKVNLLRSLRDPRWTATLLVPTNAAFKNLERDHNVDYSLLTGPLLSRIINYHVISGVALSVAGLSYGQQLSTQQGTTVAVDTRAAARVVIRGFAAAGCITKEVRAGNVAIFLIDAVLVPNLNPVPGCPSVIDLATTLGLTDFVALANYHGPWGQQLSSTEYVGTVFIPRNSVLTWRKNPTQAQAGQIISNHVAVRGAPLTDSNMLQDQGITFFGGSTYNVDRMNKARGLIFLRSAGRASVKIQNSYQACSATVHIVNKMLS